MARTKKWRRRIEGRARTDWRGGYIRLEEGGHFYVPAKMDVMAALTLVQPHRPDPMIGNFCRPGHVAIDAGANLGEWTLPMAQAVGPTGRVFAFEPVPYLAQAIDKTLRINALTHARVVDKALAEKDGQTTFIYDEDHTGMSSFLGSLAEGTTTKDITVETITLDSFADSEKLDRLDFIKMDVQGYEGKVMDGARDVLSRLRPALVIEAGAETADERAAIVDLLKSADYEMAGIDLEYGILEMDWEDYHQLKGPFQGNHCNVVFIPLRRP